MRASAALRFTGRLSSGGSSRPTSGTDRTSIERYGEQQDPRGLDDPGLAGHLRRARALLRRVRVGHRRLRRRPATCGAEDPPGGNPFEAPRSRGYPHPPLEVNTVRATSSRGLREARAASVPAAGRDHLAGLIDAVREPSARGASTAASARGSAARWTRSRARRHPPSGRAGYGALRGAARLEGAADRDRRRRARDRRHVRRRHGAEHFQPAEVVVVSAFTLENNRLLLLSRSKEHPTGSATTAGASARTTPTRSTPRRSPACGRARS